MTHGRYSRFLTPEETEDFEAFKEHFDLTEDLAFAATKIYHEAEKEDPSTCRPYWKSRARSQHSESKYWKA